MGRLESGLEDLEDVSMVQVAMLVQSQVDGKKVTRFEQAADEEEEEASREEAFQYWPSGVL